jgi:hypothetical protein
VVFAAYWFLLLTPKRDEAAKLDETLTQAQADRDAAVSQAGQATAARADFAQDYAALVRLGKAIPSSVDMPSLLVQLDRAAAGTDIRFQRISTGARTPVTVSAPTSEAGAAGAPAGDAAAGGAAAATGAGQAAEQAGETVPAADAANAAAGAATPPTGSSSGTTGAGSSAGTLDSVPLEFTFDGSFFNLADFFHDLKRYVRLSGEGVSVRGRLMTIDSLTLTPTAFPQIEAQVTATVYLSPKGQGVTAGAGSEGPAPASPTPTTPPPASAGGGAAPTATAAAQ